MDDASTIESISMSRAFVQESDENLRDDDVPAIKNPLPPGVKNYMTPEGAERLRRELYELVNQSRPRLAAELSRDMSETAAVEHETLIKRRRQLREMERRIEYLTAMLDILEVVDRNPGTADRVLFGVRVYVVENGKDEKAFEIVGVDESDPSKGRISWISPLAKALISKRVGETAEPDLPGKSRKFEIKKIEPI
jgi:transcription elongation factor GreB